MPTRTFWSFSTKTCLSMWEARVQMNSTTAKRMRHILSWVKVVRVGISLSYIEAAPSFSTTGPRLVTSDTTTSVELFFSKIEIIGIRCLSASACSSFLAISQTAIAMDPFTCWLLSVANCSFNWGRTLVTMRLELQWLHNSTNLLADSDLTSASLSPNRLTYIGTILASTTVVLQWRAINAADSAAAKRKRHDCLLAEAAFSDGNICSWTLALSNLSARGIALDSAYTLTESFESSSNYYKWGSKKVGTSSGSTLSASTDNAWAAPLLTIGVSSLISFPNFLQTSA